MLVGNKVGKLAHVRSFQLTAHRAWPNMQVDMEAARQVDYQAAKVRHSRHERLPLLLLLLPLRLCHLRFFLSGICDTTSNDLH
jgi:hypothetical protein